MKVVLKNVRLSFPDVFDAVQYEGKGAYRYNATFLIEPGSENDKKVRAAIVQVANEAWGKKADAMLKSLENNSGKYCYLNGDLKDYEGYAGNMYLSSHRRQVDGPPGVFGRTKDSATGELARVTAADGVVYGGCYVNASVDVYAQPDGAYQGMRCGLTSVQFFKDGDAFSGVRAASDEDFDDLGVEDEETDVA